jgi:anti-sigma factor RsiW
MTCQDPVSWATLVDYWAGEQDELATVALEEHLFGCADCTATSARVAAVTEALRAAIPPVISRRRVDQLRAHGTRVL